MKLSAADAALLSPAERELVQSRGPWHVKDLVRAIDRTRRLRDKSRDLLKRQTIAKRRSGKGAANPDANERSRAKARVFERALESFQKQLAAIDADSTRAVAAGQNAEKVASRARPAGGAGKGAAKKSAAKKPARKATAKKAASKKTTAGKTAAKKGAVKKAAAKKSAAKKTAAKKTAAKKTAARRGSAPRKTISSKARMPLERSSGPRSAQTTSAASRRTRAKKSRRG